MDTETTIRDLLERWRQASQARDVPAIMACYASDVRAFDAIGKLQYRAREAYGEHWQACMTMCGGRMVFEIEELEIVASADLALAHYICRCGTVDDSGAEQVGWMRATVAFRKDGGRWLITHDHYSAPFDPESCKARFERD